MYIEFKESGATRKGLLVNCKVCQKEFPTRADKPPRDYCSKSCYWQSRKIREEVVCAKCGKVYDKSPSKKKNSKSGLFFCTKKCKDEAQQLGENGIKEIMPSHYGTSETRRPEVYRRIYKESNNLEVLSCTRCKYHEFECGIDIHHLDGDCTNNTKDNLLALCAPCHRAMHHGLWKLESMGC